MLAKAVGGWGPYHVERRRATTAISRQYYKPGGTLGNPLLLTRSAHQHKAPNQPNTMSTNNNETANPPASLPPSAADELPAPATNSNNVDQETQPPKPYSAFSPAMRTYLTYLLGFTITLSTLTATIYFPLIPLLSTTFSVSIQSVNLTVTAYAVAQALAPALFASLADCFGRRPVLLGLIALFAAASLGLALNKTSYAGLVALRVLQSVGGSPTPAIAYGIVADVAPVAERGAMLGPLLATCNALSAAGPVVGGAVALATAGAVSYTHLTLPTICSV